MILMSLGESLLAEMLPVPAKSDLQNRIIMLQ